MGSFSRGQLIEQVNVTSAGTNTLSSTSLQIQYFNGTTQTIKLPPTTFTAAADAIVGQFFEIYNAGSGNITMQYQDGTSFTPAPTVLPNTVLIVKLISVSTANGTWAWDVSTSSDVNSFTLGSTSVSLGSTVTTISGLTLASAANTGTTTFPGTSSIDGSGNAILGGNLTVSGTGTSSVGGKFAIGNTNADPFSRGYTTSAAVISTSGSSALQIDAATGNAAYFDMGVNSVRIFELSTDVTGPEFGTVGALPMKFATNNGAVALTLDASQNAIVAQSLSVGGGITPTGTGITAGPAAVVKNTGTGTQNTTIPSSSTSSGDTAAYAFGAHTTGIIIINDTTNYKTATYVIYANGSALGVMTADTEYSTTANTNSKVNVTVSGGTVSVQNYTGSSITVQVTLIQG